MIRQDYYRVIIISFLLMFTGITTFSQSEVHVSGKDSTATIIPKHSLFAGTGFGSNMIYMGLTISQNKPFEYASLIYGFKNELYLSVSAVHLTDVSPFAAFSSGSLSYSHSFNSWFDLAAGVSRYQIAPSLADTLFNSFTYGEVNVGLDWRILYTRFSSGGIFSTDSKAYFQIKNSRYFETKGFGKKQINISFEPYANLIFGTVTKVTTSEGTTTTITPPFGKRGTGSFTGSGSGTGTTTYTDVFSLLEFDFGMPVSLNLPRLTIEIEPGYALPMYEDTSYPGTKGFLLLGSIFIKIF